MPRAITAVDTGPGFARYVLGRREAFTLQAVSFVLADPTLAGNASWDVFDCLDPKGAIIYRQMLGYVQYRPALYSLAAHGQPWTVDFDGGEYFPGYLSGATYPVVSAPLPLLQLTGSCTVRAYASTYANAWPVDLFEDLDTTVTVPNLHLWVADGGEQGFDFDGVGNAILLGSAA